MKKSLSPAQALSQAISVIGGQAATARSLGIGRCAVYQWVVRKQAVPIVHAPIIEELTRQAGKTVPARLLRPDVRWDLVRA